MIEHFTEFALKVIMVAHKEMQRAGCQSIETEHVLLGLIQTDDGKAYTALRDSNVTCDCVRAHLAGSVPAVGQVRFSREVEELFRLAKLEAERIGHPLIGTEHLLLGLIRQGHGKAFKILEDLMVSPTDLEAKLNERIYGGSAIAGILPEKGVNLQVVPERHDSSKLRAFIGLPDTSGDEPKQEPDL